MPDTFPHDRFDVVPDDLERVGAHRTPRKRGRGWLWFAWSALATVVLVAAGVLGLFFINGNLGFKNPTPSSTSTSTATPTPTATITPTVNASLKVTVLNGTTIEGAAGTVATTLQDAGWQNVSTANANDTTITKTVVYYSTDANKAAALGVAQSLPGSTIAQTQVYVDSGADITVVIGSDYKPPAS